MTVVIAPPREELIAGEELLAMGDIGPCELIDGKIVHMSPTGDEHCRAAKPQSAGLSFHLGI